MRSLLAVHDVSDRESRWDRVLRFLGKRIPDHFDLSRRERGWMGTSTGRKFFPLDPRPEDVDIRDIARGLSMTCRYAGQVRKFYSVAEHCYHVSVHVPKEFALEGLLHDSSEAYIGDMIRPLKHQPEMYEFRRAETAIEAAVARRFALETTPEAHEAVKEIDNRILVDEINALSACPEYYLVTPGLGDVPRLGVHLRCWDPKRAEIMFLSRFKELTRAA